MNVLILDMPNPDGGYSLFIIFISFFSSYISKNSYRF